MYSRSVSAAPWTRPKESMISASSSTGLTSPGSNRVGRIITVACGEDEIASTTLSTGVSRRAGDADGSGCSMTTVSACSSGTSTGRNCLRR